MVCLSATPVLRESHNRKGGQSYNYGRNNPTRGDGGIFVWTALLPPPWYVCRLLYKTVNYWVLIIKNVLMCIDL